MSGWHSSGRSRRSPNTPENQRHAYLLQTTLRLAGLVNAGALSEQDAIAGLRSGGARANGMGEAAVPRGRSGMAVGFKDGQRSRSVAGGVGSSDGKKPER